MKRAILIVIATLASATSSYGFTAPTKPAGVSLATPVVCIGNRLTYKNFNDCARRRGNSAAYCSRICR